MLRAAIVAIALLALVLGGPLGQGGIAAAAGEVADRGQGSDLARELEALPAAQRAQVERRLGELLETAGVDLTATETQEQLAAMLGFGKEEVARAIAEFNAQLGDLGSSPSAAPIAFLFVAAALIFAPSVFQTIGGTVYGTWESIAAADGVEKFEPRK